MNLVLLIECGAIEFRIKSININGHVCTVQYTIGIECTVAVDTHLYECVRCAMCVYDIQIIYV